jgi:hypothetical protein
MNEVSKKNSNNYIHSKKYMEPTSIPALLFPAIFNYASLQRALSSDWQALIRQLQLKNIKRQHPNLLGYKSKAE